MSLMYLRCLVLVVFFLLSKLLESLQGVGIEAAHTNTIILWGVPESPLGIGAHMCQSLSQGILFVRPSQVL